MLLSACRQAVYTPQEVSSHIVRHLVSHAEEAVGSHIYDAVIYSTGACHLYRPCSSYHVHFHAPDRTHILFCRQLGRASGRVQVITVPAHFDERQRTATVEAGMLGGLKRGLLLQGMATKRFPARSCLLHAHPELKHSSPLWSMR